MARVARSKLLRWGVALILGCIVLAAIGLAWIVHLDHVVTREFQGRHWSIPARVYAAPLELYVGAQISANDLEEELRRLHYRPGDPIAGPGLYRRRGGSFDLHARRVRFIDEQREPQLVSISAGPNSITRLVKADGSLMTPLVFWTSDTV